MGRCWIDPLNSWWDYLSRVKRTCSIVLYWSVVVTKHVHTERGTMVGSKIKGPCFWVPVWPGKFGRRNKPLIVPFSKRGVLNWLVVGFVGQYCWLIIAWPCTHKWKLSSELSSSSYTTAFCSVSPYSLFNLYVWKGVKLGRTLLDLLRVAEAGSTSLNVASSLVAVVKVNFTWKILERFWLISSDAYA